VRLRLKRVLFMSFKLPFQENSESDSSFRSLEMKSPEMVCFSDDSTIFREKDWAVVSTARRVGACLRILIRRGKPGRTNRGPIAQSVGTKRFLALAQGLARLAVARVDMFPRQMAALSALPHTS
jgi:hypothetical protein